MLQHFHNFPFAQIQRVRGPPFEAKKYCGAIIGEPFVPSPRSHSYFGGKEAMVARWL